MNLAQAIHHVYRILRANKTTETTPSYSDVIEYINIAIRKVYEDCASHRAPLEISSASISTVASTASYSVSSNLATILDKQVFRVTYRDVSTDPYLPLAATTRGILGAKGFDPDDTTNGKGIPVWWYFDDNAAGLGLYPIPERSSASGLKVYFATVPTSLSRYWGTPTTTTLTVNVANLGTALTFSSSATVNAAALDEFGVISDTPYLPTTWYSMSAVSGTSGTIAAYAGATNTAAKFVTSQIFTLGADHPTEAWAVVFYAASLALMDQDPERASLYFDESNPNSKYNVKLADLIIKIQERYKSMSMLL